MKAERLQAALKPQIEQLQSSIAALSRNDSQTSLASQSIDSHNTKKNGDLVARR